MAVSKRSYEQEATGEPDQPWESAVAELEAEVERLRKLFRAADDANEAEIERLRAIVERQDQGGLPCACEFDDEGRGKLTCMYHERQEQRVQELEAAIGHAILSLDVEQYGEAYLALKTTLDKARYVEKAGKQR